MLQLLIFCGWMRCYLAAIAFWLHRCKSYRCLPVRPQITKAYLFKKIVQWCRGDDLRIETLHLFGHGLLCCGDTPLMFLLWNLGPYSSDQDDVIGPKLSAYYIQSASLQDDSTNTWKLLLCLLSPKLGNFTVYVTLK